MTLPKPVGKQARVVYLAANGHLVVLGTAGTGKTVMACHRAAHLASPSTTGSGPTLLVTYGNPLVRHLRRMGTLGTGVTVETYAKFGLGYLKSRGLPADDAVSQGGGREAFIRDALKEVRAANPRSQVLQRSLHWFDEEFRWIAGQGLRDESEYLEADRIGRKQALGPAARSRVWAAYRAYVRLRIEGGKPYDWYDLASAVRAALAKDGTPRRYRHIVVDEAQDLSPEALRSLAEAADPDGSVTIFADYAQQIYGARISWRSVGLTLRRPETFTDNYRNSGPIARLAIAMAALPHFKDVDDLVEPVEPTAAGPPPTLASFNTLTDESAWVRAQAAASGTVGSVAVLAETWDWAAAAAPPGAMRLDRSTPPPGASVGVYYGTYHSAKGLEFDTVIMVGCTASRHPRYNDVAAFGEDEAAARDARLLYVGVTRARTGLIVTRSGPLTSLLPSDPSLWVTIQL